MGKNDQDKLYFQVFNKSCNRWRKFVCTVIRKLIYLKNEGRKGKSVKNVLYNFHCSFRGNNKNFRFMSPLRMNVCRNVHVVLTLITFLMTLLNRPRSWLAGNCNSFYRNEMITVKQKKVEKSARNERSHREIFSRIGNLICNQMYQGTWKYNTCSAYQDELFNLYGFSQINFLFVAVQSLRFRLIFTFWCGAGCSNSE